ncbi:MAG: hypothetical protein INH41_02260 [Myxococcaceae bacterium]|jgi:hypothetical protein|nr:hypothetical protein [Myxococcaceae bacterium]MCA3011203.1 hypothetical protein [Myxococcaceae bacterium]
MKAAFEVLLAVLLVGGVDVLWFHLHRHRRYASAPSVAEQSTHLVRHLLFAALGAGFARGLSPTVLLALLAVDLVNSLVDLALEPRSRAAQGGVSGLESVLHGLATFGLGVVAGLAWLGDAVFIPDAVDVTRGVVTAVLAVGLFTVELALTVRHRLRRVALAP